MLNAMTQAESQTIGGQLKYLPVLAAGSLKNMPAGLTRNTYQNSHSTPNMVSQPRSTSRDTSRTLVGLGSCKRCAGVQNHADAMPKTLHAEVCVRISTHYSCSLAAPRFVRNGSAGPK